MSTIKLRLQFFFPVAESSATQEEKLPHTHNQGTWIYTTNHTIEKDLELEII